MCKHFKIARFSLTRFELSFYSLSVSSHPFLPRYKDFPERPRPYPAAKQPPDLSGIARSPRDWLEWMEFGPLLTFLISLTSRRLCGLV